MSSTGKTVYLEKLLKVYEEKLKRFRLALALFLGGTTAFFFLIVYPYMTVIGNLESCRVNQLQCNEDKQSEIEERFSELTTIWGNIPVSTAEVAIFFPVGIAGGYAVVASQMQGLVRLRQAIAKQIKSLDISMDVTLIAPLLIDPKQGLLDRLAGILTFLFPFSFFLYSIRLILNRIEVVKNELPYFQSIRFYKSLYFLSSILIIYSLVKTGMNFYKKEKEI